MPEFSANDPESTRKIAARIRGDLGQRVALVTQAHAATLMEVSASTVSRVVADLDQFCHLLAAVGLQLAPSDAVVVSRDDMQALERMAYKYLQTRIESGVRRV